MKKLGRKDPFEKLFPNAAGRKAGDEAIDALALDVDMRTYIDTWEAAYYGVAKKSPFR